MRRLGSMSVCTESVDLINSCPSWSFLPVLVPSTSVNGGFSVSRGMRLWETEPPSLLTFDEAFVWIFQQCKINKEHFIFLKITTQLVDLDMLLVGNSLAMKWCLKFFNSLHVLCVLVILVRPIATLWWNRVKVPHLQFCVKCWSSHDPKYFGVLLLVVSRHDFVLRAIYVSTFTVNFYDAFFLFIMMSKTLSAKIRSCDTDKCINSVPFMLFRFSLNLKSHLPQFLDICNWFCFVCIAVGRR